jgi:hypothetical protein
MSFMKHFLFKSLLVILFSVGGVARPPEGTLNPYVGADPWLTDYDEAY